MRPKATHPVLGQDLIATSEGKLFPSLIVQVVSLKVLRSQSHGSMMSTGPIRVFSIGADSFFF